MSFKRTEITQRDSAGNPLRVEKGWQAEIDGVPVVLCRVGSLRAWRVFEPTCGKQVCGAWGDAREDVLSCVSERVGRIAAQKGIGTGDLLRSLIAEHTH